MAALGLAGYAGFCAFLPSRQADFAFCWAVAAATLGGLALSRRHLRPWD